MKIAIDLRSLHTGSISGVENYIVNVVEHLLTLDKKNTYTLFYNSFKPVDVGHFHFINSRVIKTRIPNKLLNSSLYFFNYPSFERLIGDFDCLFLPNLNPFALGKGKKLAVTVHDISPLVTPDVYGAKDRLWHKVLRIQKSLARADIIFAVSEFTKNDLVGRLGLSEEKIRVVHPGIDKNTFHRGLSQEKLREVRNVYGLPSRFLLFLNTLEPRKNLDSVLEAFERIRHPLHLVIAGKPGFRHKGALKKIAASKKKAYIHYLGYVEEADKPYLMALSSALLYPSFYEGFGFQVLEAMSLGVPVIASSVTSLPGVAGDAALMINPYNIDDIAGAIIEVMTSKGLRDQMIDKGLKRAEMFNWQSTARNILNGFESLSS